MASEVLSKEERASEVKDAQWNETYTPDEICQREGECGRTILRYEATVVQAEARIAELESERDRLRGKLSRVLLGLVSDGECSIDVGRLHEAAEAAVEYMELTDEPEEEGTVLHGLREALK